MYICYKKKEKEKKTTEKQPACFGHIMCFGLFFKNKIKTQAGSQIRQPVSLIANLNLTFFVFLSTEGGQNVHFFAIISWKENQGCQKHCFVFFFCLQNYKSPPPFLPTRQSAQFHPVLT